MTTRTDATARDVSELVLQLRKLKLDGFQCSVIMDCLYDCIADSKYMGYGSIDLDDIAARMFTESENTEKNARKTH